MSEKVEYHGGFMSPEKADELRAELTALRASNMQLREALRPFAEYGAVLQGQRVRGDKVMVQLWDYKITVDDMRNAATALSRTGEE